MHEKIVAKLKEIRGTKYTNISDKSIEYFATRYASLVTSDEDLSKIEDAVTPDFENMQGNINHIVAQIKKSDPEPDPQKKPDPIPEPPKNGLTAEELNKILSEKIDPLTDELKSTKLELTAMKQKKQIDSIRNGAMEILKSKSFNKQQRETFLLAMENTPDSFDTPEKLYEAAQGKFEGYAQRLSFTTEEVDPDKEKSEKVDNQFEALKKRVQAQAE